MNDETKKGQWRECELAGLKRYFWVPPVSATDEGKPSPIEEYRSYLPPEEPPAQKFFCSDGAGVGEQPAEEDDLWSFWRKDYEAARQFAYQAHELLKICRKYEDMLALCGATTPESEEGAICVLRHLCANMDSLADLKIKKLPHRDAVFMSQPKPYGDV